MNTREILQELIKIQKNLDFSENRNDARKVYKLLTNNSIELDVEQTILEENIFRIERMLITEEDRNRGCEEFIKALIKIINTIDYNINGVNYKAQKNNGA